ncbi:hypothetical protein [Devosia aurantiaca]|uniref:Nitrite/Sulfite reductase ferredoxin-like domain-containing protein n=1 Tax=Devosia aurantiaca TaxID=2714858 RepID=A0A6M1SPN1_9HYPH|nr:hypothetical protein [Devosia aurantiaca]
MADLLDIVDFARRGACPTLDAPMQTGDGLLARVRIAGGRVSPSQLAGLARLAMQHGNGLVEVTARGNLQVRGLSEDSSAPFAAAVTELVPVETGLVIDVSPIAGRILSSWLVQLIWRRRSGQKCKILSTCWVRRSAWLSKAADRSRWPR